MTRIKLLALVATLSTAAFASVLLVNSVTGSHRRPVSTTMPPRPITAGAHLRDYPRPVSASLLLRGTVLEIGAARAGTMTVRVGQSVKTVPVTLPDFTVSIAAVDRDDMVSVEVTAPGYRYASILGSYAKLALRAGADAQLTVPEFDRLQLSPMSTALQFFVERTLGGRAPVSDTEHEGVMPNLQGEDVALAASMLSAFARGQVALPDGVSNGYEVLADRAAFASITAEYPALAEQVPDILATTPAVAIAPIDVRSTLLLTPPLPLSDAPLFVLYQDVKIIVSTPYGHDIHASISRRNPSFDDAYVDGALVETPRNAIVTDDLVRKVVNPAQGEVDVLERSTLQSETYRRVFVGDRSSLWVATQKYLLTYPDEPTVPSGSYTSARLYGARVLSSVQYPMLRSQLTGKRALPVFCPYSQPVILVECEYAIYDFRAGGSGTIEDVGYKIDSGLKPISGYRGAEFSWRTSVHDGLHLDAYGVTTTLWRLEAANGHSTFMAYLSTTPDGADTVSVVGTTSMLPQGNPDSFEELSVEGSWRYGSFLQSYKYYDLNSPTVSSLFVRSADGTVIEQQRRDEPSFSQSYDFDRASSWRLFDGRLYDTRVISNAGDVPCSGGVRCIGFNNCESAYAAGASECSPSRVRYFRPMSRDGNRVYGIEDLYTRTDDVPGAAPPYIFTRVSRPNFYEKQ